MNSLGNMGDLDLVSNLEASQMEHGNLDHNIVIIYSPGDRSV